MKLDNLLEQLMKIRETQFNSEVYIGVTNSLGHSISYDIETIQESNLDTRIELRIDSVFLDYVEPD